MRICGVHVPWFMWRWEDSFQGWILSFHLVGQGIKLRSSWVTANSLTQWAISLVWELLFVQILIHAVWSTNNTNENWMPQFQEYSSMKCYFHPTGHMRKLSQQRGWWSCPGHLTRYQRSFQVLVIQHSWSLIGEEAALNLGGFAVLCCARNSPRMWAVGLRYMGCSGARKVA